MKKTLVLFVAGFLLQSCGQDSTVTKVNKEIDQKLRTAIAQKNDSLLNALSDSNNKALLNLASPEFKEDMYRKLDEVLWPFRKGELETKSVVFDEFHNVHEKFPNNSTIRSDEHGYNFKFTNNYKETYISLLRCTRNTTDDFLVTIIYARFGNDFKIIHTDIGELGLYDKTAQDYFKIAKQYEEKGYLIDAFNNADAAHYFREPSGKMLVYDNIDELPAYVKTLKATLKAKVEFPKTLQRLETAPIILNIAPAKNATEISNMIFYISQVPIKDTTGIRREFAGIKAEMKKVYPLDFNKRYMYYKVFNGKPASLNDASFFAFTDINKK